MSRGRWRVLDPVSGAVFFVGVALTSGAAMLLVGAPAAHASDR
jgi:hypothetical protein